VTNLLIRHFSAQRETFHSTQCSTNGDSVFAAFSFGILLAARWWSFKKNLQAGTAKKRPKKHFFHLSKL
jgi:hypothetical protein